MAGRSGSRPRLGGVRRSRLVRANIPSVTEAVERFFEDAKARELAEATIGKLNVLLRKQLLPWCRGKGYLSLTQLTTDELTQFRATWTDSPVSTYKKQERLKSFFHFCVAREWVKTNPVLGIKPVKMPPHRRCRSTNSRWWRSSTPAIALR